MSFLQTYDPLGSPLLSTLLAALPLLLLIYLLAAHPWHDREGRRQRGIGAPRAAFIASLVSLAMAVLVLGMPFPAAGASLVYGALSGLFPIGWVLVAAMFLYTLTVVTGQFDVVRESIVAVSADRRIQVLIIAFALGSFLEGAAGFGIPVAIAGAMMVGLGFRPFQAAVLNLLANSVPVAFGAIGTPVLTLGAVTNLDPNRLGALSALQLAPFCLVTPFLVITVMVKMDRKPFRKVLEVWPALLVSGVTFTLGEYQTAAYLGPGLVGILGGLVTLVALLALLTVWRPAAPYDGDPIAASAPARRLAPMAGAPGRQAGRGPRWSGPGCRGCCSRSSSSSGASLRSRLRWSGRWQGSPPCSGGPCPSSTRRSTGCLRWSQSRRPSRPSTRSTGSRPRAPPSSWRRWWRASAWA